MQIRRIAVVGGGTMGQGIAQVASQAGIHVLLKEISQEALDRSLAAISAQLDEQIAKWGITDKEKKAILARVTPTFTFNGFEKVDLVIEAVEEDQEIKIELFKNLNTLCGKHTIFATNTSTLSVSKLATESHRPDRFIGVHFQPPVHKKPLVELVRGLDTGNDTYKAVRAFAEEVGKVPVETFEWPGYITTRIMMPFINEAVYALMEGVASAEDIDKAMMLGCGMEMGPLHFADAMGLDTVVYQMEYLFRELGDIKYRPCPLLKKMIRAGQLGVKSGKGFFEYKSTPEAARVHMSIAS